MTVTQHNPGSTERSTYFSERKRALKVTAALMTGLGSVGLAGCATGNADAAPQPVETSITSVGSNDGEVPQDHSTDNSGEVPQGETTPELITNYESISWEQFNAKPQDDRLKYVDYRIETGLELHTEILAGRDKPEYTELTDTSSPQEIVDNFVYVLDEANYQFEIDTATGEQQHDENEGIKYLSGAFLKVEGSGRSNIHQNEIDRHLKNAFGIPYVDDTKLTATGSVTKTGELEGREISYQDINFYTEDGEDFIGRWVKTEFSSIDGTPKTTWLLDQTFEPEQPLADY